MEKDLMQIVELVKKFNENDDYFMRIDYVIRPVDDFSLSFNPNGPVRVDY